MLHVIPKNQSKGESAFKKETLRFSIFFALFCFFLVFSVFLMIVWLDGFSNLGFLYVAAVAAGVGGVITFFLLMLSSRSTIPHAIQATKVFEVLGYKNPSSVNATANHYDAELAWITENGDDDEPFQIWVHRYQDSDLEK